MRTRKGLCYPHQLPLPRMCSETPKLSLPPRKRQKISPEIPTGDSNFFESLPDDLVLSILCKLSSTASSPSDFISVLITYVSNTTTTTTLKVVFFYFIFLCCVWITDFLELNNRCKRLNALGRHSLVLSKASHKTFSVKAKNWSDSAHRFLKRCSDAGNIEACYTLGMVRT